MGFGFDDCKRGGKSTDGLIIMAIVLLLIVLASDSGFRLFNAE